MYKLIEIDLNERRNKMEWNYKSKIEESNGYEDCNILKKYTHEVYEKSTEEDRLEIVKEVFNVYRNKNIFPIKYYNEDGINKEIQKCIDKEVSFENNNLSFKLLQGIDLCKFLFPNLFLVQAGSTNNNSLYERFMDDHKLKRAIRLVFDMKKGSYCNTTELRNKLELIGGNVATNFHPMKAKALYEKYCPKDGIIYDFACGFGGRMLGALTSKNNYKYFGVEPCTETFNNLNILGSYIEKSTNRENIYKVYCVGSEDYKCKKEYVDFAFSSPPYFNLERYSEEETQCYNKYPTLDKWFEGYVKVTIKNIYDMLKYDRYYAVNIADFNFGNKRVEYVDKWIEISKEIGFEYVEKISMKVETRKGLGHDNSKEKQEGIFVFRKVK